MGVTVFGEVACSDAGWSTDQRLQLPPAHKPVFELCTATLRLGIQLEHVSRNRKYQLTKEK